MPLPVLIPSSLPERSIYETAVLPSLSSVRDDSSWPDVVMVARLTYEKTSCFGECRNSMKNNNLGLPMRALWLSLPRNTALPTDTEGHRIFSFPLKSQRPLAKRDDLWFSINTSIGDVIYQTKKRASLPTNTPGTGTCAPR